MSDFVSQMQTVENAIKGTAKGLFAKIDQMTFRMTIDGLKSNDYEALCITIDQLVKEKKPVSIPPLYVVSEAHPNVRAREKAKEAIKSLDPKGEVERLVAGKSIKEATNALIERFGNFKS